MMRRNGSQAVHQQGIVLKPMPLLKRWYEVGAPMN
jgi:hypothetical protein